MKKKVKKELPLKPPMYLIKSALRRIFPRTGLYVKVLNNAIATTKGVRGGKQHNCAECGKPYGTGKVRVDHIDPVVPIGLTVNDMSVQELYDRLWCNITNLQVLCEECHDAKTKVERTERKKAKAKI